MANKLAATIDKTPGAGMDKTLDFNIFDYNVDQANNTRYKLEPGAQENIDYSYYKGDNPSLNLSNNKLNYRVTSNDTNKPILPGQMKKRTGNHFMNNIIANINNKTII